MVGNPTGKSMAGEVAHSGLQMEST